MNWQGRGRKRSQCVLLLRTPTKYISNVISLQAGIWTQDHRVSHLDYLGQSCLTTQRLGNHRAQKNLQDTWLFRSFGVLSWNPGLRWSTPKLTATVVNRNTNEADIQSNEMEGVFVLGVIRSSCLSLSVSLRFPSEAREIFIFSKTSTPTLVPSHVLTN